MIELALISIQFLPRGGSLVNPSEWTLILLYGFFWGAGLWVFKNLWASEKKMRQAWSPLARLAYFVGHVLVGLGVALLSTFGQRVTHGGPLRVFVTVVAVWLVVALAFRRLTSPQSRRSV